MSTRTGRHLASLKAQAVSRRKTAEPKKPTHIFGQSVSNPVRTRFAPSPTGYLHLGSLRTALYNKLIASASTKGDFILRLEDTDQSRLVADAEQRLYEDLKWSSITWDEGPDIGGPYGPYKQSERLDIYRDHVQKLVDGGHAYRCFCKPEDLEEQKRLLHEAGKPTIYPGTCRSTPESESQARAEAGEPHVVRFKGDAFGNLGFRDAIYGPFQKKDAEEDFILLKTDGFPTYHLANVVDDHLMKITHVIRGEEWLISTPKHIALYKAFGWEPPTFAHLGLLVNDDGTKLSKRHDSANMATYRDQGYSPMPLNIWLASLGSSFTFDMSKPQLKSGQFPRDTQDIANALSYKFTRGGIKLHKPTLDHYEVKWRRAVMVNPLTTDLASREEAIITDQVLTPLAREIARMTSDTTRSPFFPDSPTTTTQPPGETEANVLVPALTDPETSIPYLRRLYRHSASENHALLGDMMDFVRANPHYFWRVPPRLYRRSLLARDAYSAPVMRALEWLCRKLPEWDRDQTPLRIVASLSHKLAELDPDVESAQLYRTHRLVGRGDPAVASHGASIMFDLLGRDEWTYRTDFVSRLIEQLESGGDAVRRQWALEAQRHDPSFTHPLLDKDQAEGR